MVGSEVVGEPLRFKVVGDMVGAVVKVGSRRSVAGSVGSATGVRGGDRWGDRDGDRRGDQHDERRGGARLRPTVGEVEVAIIRPSWLPTTWWS